MSKYDKTVEALRYNQGKPQYSMLDLKCFEHCAYVLEFGAKKYSRDNWKLGMTVSSLLDSMLRHIAAIQSGEVVDPESGLPHIGHLQCNAMFLGNINNEQDVPVLPKSSQGMKEEKSSEVHKIRIQYEHTYGERPRR